MDEDSLSRDCEPFFESDGEEESTDGKRARRRRKVTIMLLLPYLFLYPRRFPERGCSAAVGEGRGHGPGGIPSQRPHGSGALAARVRAGVGLQRKPIGSGRQQQRRTGERNFTPSTHVIKSVLR